MPSTRSLMGPKAAVFFHNGLGDGVNCLVLSNNLQLNGYQVDTYHNGMGSMQNWFPHLPIKSYPGVEEVSHILHMYNWFFVVWNDTSEFIRKLIEEGKRRMPDRIKVLYLYPSSNIVNEPYYSDCLADPSLSVAANMRIVCERVMHLPRLTKSNGFIPPEGLQFQKFPKRVVIHPTSTRETKNWPKEHFVKLALHLKEEGFQPVFVPGKAEWENWKEILPLGLEIVDFPTLDELASYIFESGYLVGNNSGLAHLASALGIPTLTFFRRKAQAKMWAPSFTKGIALAPYSLIPNIRGFRFRDRYWKYLISVGRARRGFELLVQT